MPRLIPKTASGPIEVKPQEKSVWICACGLTKNEPFCDGSHKITKKEEDWKVYVYNCKGEVKQVNDA